MKKIITALLVLSLVLLVACQPMEPKAEPKPEPAAPTPKPAPAPEPAPEPAKDEITTPPPMAPLGMDIEKVCPMLLPANRFAEICKLDEANIVMTTKESDRTCWITFTDKYNKKYTAGLTIVDWMNAEESNREFDRGLSMRRMDALSQVGDRNYNYQQVDRENIVWVKNKFLTTIGASTQLCTKEQLLQLAQEVNGRLK